TASMRYSGQCSRTILDGIRIGRSSSPGARTRRYQNLSQRLRGDTMHSIWISVSDGSRCRTASRGWLRGLHPQTPVEELHLLIDPPAGGTKTEFVHDAIGVLKCPVDRRLH